MMIKVVGQSSRSSMLILLPKYLVHRIYKFQNSQKLPKLTENNLYQKLAEPFVFEILAPEDVKT
jgi:hypothetical protein